MTLWDIFENRQERRLRAAWRIAAFILISGILLVLISLLITELADFPVLRFLGPAVAVTIATWTTGKWLDRRPFAGFGMQLSRLWWMEFAWGSLLAAGVSALFMAGAVWMGWYSFTGFGWLLTPEPRFWWHLLGYTVLMLSVGYYEELAFRGYLNLNLYEGFSGLAKGKTWVAGGLSIACISALFGFVHAGNPNATVFGVINIVLAGVMLGLPFLATGRLGWSVGIHFSWNYVQGALLGLPVSGVPFEYAVFSFQPTGLQGITGGAFGLEGGLLGTGAILMILVVLVIYARKHNYLRQVHPTIQAEQQRLKQWAVGSTPGVRQE